MSWMREDNLGRIDDSEILFGVGMTMWPRSIMNLKETQYANHVCNLRSNKI